MLIGMFYILKFVIFMCNNIIFGAQIGCLIKEAEICIQNLIYLIIMAKFNISQR